MSNMIEPIEIHQVLDLGIERGLTVVMKPLLNDYFYSMLPVKGWKASRDSITCYFNKLKKPNSDFSHSREQLYFVVKIKSRNHQGKVIYCSCKIKI